MIPLLPVGALTQFAAKLTSGTFNIFTGVVLTSKTGTYVTLVAREGFMDGAADAGNPMQAIPLASTMANFLGFREVIQPQPGDRVLCAALGANVCYILGSIPQNNMTSRDTPCRSNIGAGDPAMEDANRQGHEEKFPVNPSNRRPSDIVDGEWGVANEFGVMLALSQHLAQLKASDLAQVQCYLLDDLVRIISHNFQHYTAMGEYNVYHDGKSIMAEFNATHQPGETYGRPLVETDSGAPIFSETSQHTKDDSVDFFKITENERIKAIERFKLLLGRMGDFVHLFLCRPHPDETRNYDEPPGEPDTGLADVHIGTDGGVHLRSVKEVFIEKTNWIRVPHRFKDPADPTGDKAQDLNYEDKEKFEWTEDYKYKANPFYYFLQLRDYVAYVMEKNNYRNFKTHEKDFYVNDTPGNEQNLKNINKVDKWTKLEQEPYELRTSGVYLMPNGGITIKDSWNSSIIMEGGNIYIQPAKDLILQPLRSLVAKVGKHVQVAAKEEIDFSSTEKGFRLKTDKAQYFYSDNSGIVMHAKATQPTKGSPDPESEAIEDIGGIVLKSDYGIYNYAKKEIQQYTEGKIVLQSLEGMWLQTEGLFANYTKQTMVLYADSSLLLNGEASTILTSSTGSVICAGSSSTVLGKEDTNLGVKYDEDSMFIDILKGIVPLDEVLSSLQEMKPSLEDPSQYVLFTGTEDFEKLKFNFLKSSRYGNLTPEMDAIPASLAQQDDKLTGLYSLTDWSETEVNGTLPYPGKDKFENFYMDADKPVNLESNPNGKSFSSKAESEPKPCKLNLSSLNSYKIQP
jgi:hypothetical protein